MWVGVQISHQQVAINSNFPKCSFLDLQDLFNLFEVQNKPPLKLCIVLDPSNFLILSFI